MKDIRILCSLKQILVNIILHQIGVILKFQPHYDETMLKWLGGDHSRVNFYIKWAIGHAQVPYCHDSLGTKIQLQV